MSYFTFAENNTTAEKNIKKGVVPVKEEDFDFVKNISASNADELQTKRSLIIVIRQYIQNFHEKLKCIYGGNETAFNKKLITLNVQQLELVLENIRFELNLKRNHYIFYNTFEFLATSFEGLMKNVVGINVDDGYAELKKDPNFQMDLLMVASEIDVSKYVNPKTSLLGQLGLKYWNKYRDFIKNKQEFLANIKLNIDDKKIQETAAKHNIQ